MCRVGRRIGRDSPRVPLLLNYPSPWTHQDGRWVLRGAALMSGSDPRQKSPPSKVPPVILAFWVVKILATTVGETGGDALSMTLSLGYAVSTLVFLGFFAV